MQPASYIWLHTYTYVYINNNCISMLFSDENEEVWSDYDESDERNQTDNGPE